MAAAVTARALVKTFGQVRALDGLDLTVDEGEVHGFLGPNGAGKSTTIRVILGLLRADSGEVAVLGGDPRRDAVELHRRIAYVPGDVALWPSLTGGEVIDLLGRIRGGLDEGRRAEMLDRFDLDPTKKCRTYSKGNRQKVALVAALSGPSELLVLDEPTSGLDPLMERTFREILSGLRSDGRTVLLSSHILSEIEASSDRMSIIKEGRIVETGSLADLRHLRRTTIDAVTDRPVPAADLASQGRHDLRIEPSGAGSRVHLSVDPAALNGVLTDLTPYGVHSLTSAPPTLEQLFLENYSPGGFAPRVPPKRPRAGGSAPRVPPGKTPPPRMRAEP